MNYLDKLQEYEQEMQQTLQELVRIRSVQSPAQEGMPFGEGVHEAYRCLMDRAAADGFETENIDNYGGHIEFGGRIYNEAGEVIELSSEIMGILGHLDVVPEGNGWDFDPYGAEIREGRMYGRGTSDDKGPVAAAYYAMKAIRDAGYEPEKRVRLILGLDEETGWTGMEKYLEKAEPVDIGFTPDGEFPVVYGELGMLIFEVVKKINKSVGKGLALRSVTGGNAPNMVADTAKAVVRGDSYTELKEKLEEFKKETGYSLSTKGRGKSLEINAEGKSAHGAAPWQGINAVSILLEFLGRLEFANEDVNEYLDFYKKCIGFQLHGEALGCGLADELSGKLVLNVGMVKIDDGAARLVLNVRYPLSCTEEQVYDGIRSVVEPYNIGIVKLKSKSPLHVPKDGRLVRTLMDIYREFTGDKEAQPLVIGGGTYARAMPNTVAYGMLFPGEEDTMHKKNESISLESLNLAARIYAEAIVRLADCKPIPQPRAEMEQQL